MAFDPYREDYQRLTLRYALSIDQSNPLKAARALSSFGRKFAENRDSLPQSDADRAFNLVAQATNLIDYTLPFAPDEHADKIAGEAAHLLNEALEIDPGCHDARRMLSMAGTSSFDECYHFLKDGLDEVRDECMHERDQVAQEMAAQGDASGDDAVAATGSEGADVIAIARAMALWPCERWMAMLASKALICGRYHACISTSLALLDLDPDDLADVRFTCALAYAKLEDEAGLEALVGRCSHLAGDTDDAWLSLARIALAFKRNDLAAAESLVGMLIAAYPFAGMTLSLQNELPDGVFSRLSVAPFSEDELILAVSEASVVLQEGRDPAEHGTLGTWISKLPSVSAAFEADQAADGHRGLDSLSMDGDMRPDDTPGSDDDTGRS